MKKKLFWMFFACGLIMATLAACSSDDDKPSGNGVDDLAYLQKRIAADGSLVYGVQLGTDTKDVMSRPVATTDVAKAEFYKLMPGGAAHQGLSTASDGSITCRLTTADGKQQGTITYRPQGATVYYCAEVTFSAEVKAATNVSCLRYILYDRWPEDGNGFVKGILDGIKN